MAIYKNRRFPLDRKLPNGDVAFMNKEEEFVPVKEDVEEKSPKKGAKEADQENKDDKSSDL